MQPTHDDLRNLISNNPGQGTFEEYAHLLDTIVQRAPANLLIFGVGRDSTLWYHANKGGRTVFIEHEPTWIAQTQAQLPDAQIVPVRYWTRRWLWPLLLGVGDALFLRELPEDVQRERWDIIFVDSPQGGKWTRPGRMQSLYTAAQLARQAGRANVHSSRSESHQNAPGHHVDLLAHDCDRTVEQVYCNRYFAAESLVRTTRTLRHYRIAV